MASLLSLHDAPVALPALNFLFALDGAAELGQTMRDVGVLGQEGLAGLLGLPELRRLADELAPDRLQLVGVGLAVLVELVGGVEWLARPGKRANSVARDRQALEAFLKDSEAGRWPPSPPCTSRAL